LAVKIVTLQGNEVMRFFIFVCHATAAAFRISATIIDINDWMKAGRPRLKPSKIQVMWLGTKQQLDKIIIKDAPLLFTVVTVVESLRYDYDHTIR